MNRPPGEAAWMAGVTPVERPVARARATYDRVAACYDLAENPFEYRARNHALRLRACQPLSLAGLPATAAVATPDRN